MGGSMGLLAGGGGGARATAAKVVRAVAAAQRQTAPATTAAAASIASRHASSLPPPPPLPLTSSPPVDYHYPFGNPSLLIPTLPSRQHVASTTQPSTNISTPTSHQPSTGTPDPRRRTPSSPAAHAAPATSARKTKASLSTSQPSQILSAAASLKPRPVIVPHHELQSKQQGDQRRIRPAQLEASRRPAGQKTYDEPPAAAPPPLRRRQPPTGRDVAREESADAAALAAEEETSTSTAAEPRPRLSDPIHVLGGDPRATYLAHTLAALPNTPPVRLLLASRAYLRKWDEEGRGVRVMRAGAPLPRNRVVAELIQEPTDAALVAAASPPQSQFQRSVRSRHRRIENLIVTLSCAGSIDAIRRLKHRIDHRTTICLLQSGLGVVERLNSLCFPEAATRPRYVLGHMTHDLGYHHDKSFTVTELAPGKVCLTAYAAPPPLPSEPARTRAPSQPSTTVAGTPVGPSVPLASAHPVENHENHENRENPENRDSEHGDESDGLRLVHLLGLTPTLGAGGYDAGAFLRWKLPDMVYAAAVEPVATILDLPLDALWQNGEARALVDALVQEIVAVVRRLPETAASPALARYVRSGALQRQIQRRSFAPGGASGHCRMAQQVAAGRVTDIQFLNGYFVRRGRDPGVGVACPMNAMAVRLVRAKQVARRARLDDCIPLVGDDGMPMPVPVAAYSAAAHAAAPPRPRASPAGQFAPGWGFSSPAPQRQQPPQPKEQQRQHDDPHADDVEAGGWAEESG